MFLIALLVVGVGVSIAFGASASRETAELIVSILVILLLMLSIMKNPLNGLLLLLVLTPFLEEKIGVPLGIGIPDLSFSRFTLALLAIFMLARASIGRFQFQKPGLAELCIIAMPIGIAFSAPLVDNPISVIQTAFTRYFAPLALYFFARNLVQSKEDLHKLFAAIVLFGFLAALYGIYESITGNILFVVEGTEVDYLQVTHRDTDLTLLRGLLGRSGNFGRVLVSTIPVTFYLIFESKRSIRKSLLTGAILIQFYVLLITFNRTSWYALPISFTIIQFFYPKFRKVYFVVLIASVAAFFAFSQQINSSEVVTERVQRSTETYGGRSFRWEAAYNMWKEKPIRGWGFGQFEKVSGKYRTDGIQGNFRAIENDYLAIMVAAGLLGLAPYAVFLFVTFINSLLVFARARGPDWEGFVKPETVTIYWAVTISLLITSYTQVQSQPIVKMIPFAIAGAIIGAHQHLLGRVENKDSLFANYPTDKSSRPPPQAPVTFSSGSN
jgi:O-antigen ligase